MLWSLWIPGSSLSCPSLVCVVSGLVVSMYCLLPFLNFTGGRLKARIKCRSCHQASPVQLAPWIGFRAAPASSVSLPLCLLAHYVSSEKILSTTIQEEFLFPVNAALLPSLYLLIVGKKSCKKT